MSSVPKMYCVVFRQTLKQTRLKQTKRNNNKNKQQTLDKNKQTTNTGHPADHSTTNKYLSGSGRMSCILDLLFFVSKVCISVVFTRVFFAGSGKSLNIPGKSNNNKRTTNYLREQTKVTIQYILQPTTRPQINISGSGWMSCICF